MARAREAGAIVRSEQRQGKGNVVRRMFADIEADIYVLVDGDDTYDAGAAPAHGGEPDRSRRRHPHRAAHPYRRRRLSPRPCAGQPDADRPDRASVQRQADRHAVGLSRLFPPLRQILSLDRARASASRPS